MTATAVRLLARIDTNAPCSLMITQFAIQVTATGETSSRRDDRPGERRTARDEVPLRRLADSSMRPSNSQPVDWPNDSWSVYFATCAHRTGHRWRSDQHSIGKIAEMGRTLRRAREYCHWQPCVCANKKRANSFRAALLTVCTCICLGNALH